MGFLSPWFLGGLAALGVPVFVHLLRRHVSTPRPVSSLMFFERGTQSSTRHRRLRYLLLFALRGALVVLIVFAFADPFLRRPETGAKGRLHLIVLDKSFSMRQGTRFKEAKQQAREVLAAKPKGDNAQIIALGGQVEILTQPISNGEQLRTMLESIQPGDGHASFGELARAVRTLSETVREPIDLHLFSDMQRTAIPANFADIVLPNTVNLLLHPVSQGTAEPNWTVESVDAPPQLSDPKDSKHSRVRAVIAGFGTHEAIKAVSLVVNGKTIATKNVDVPANGRAMVEFAPLDVAYGFNRCEVRVAGNDAFPGDDASVFSVRRSDPEKVLFVHGAGEARSAAYFGAALESAAQGAFLLQSMAVEQATDVDPAKFAFVVLSDSMNLPGIFERSLAQYVARGGNVFIALGAATHRGPIPLWDTEARETRDYARNGTPASIMQIDFSHPALEREEAADGMAGWAQVKVFYAAVLDPGSARVLARLSDGLPLLLDKQLGEGHVLLFASGLDNLTNDLPLHPVFVEFVDRLARFLSGAERLSAARLVDSFVQLRLTARPAGATANVEVIDPDGHRPLTLSEARTVESFRLSRAGFYQIRFANGKDAVIGVNPDRRESDLQPIPTEMQELWSKSSAPESPHSASAGPNEVQYRSVSLWWYVMLLALVTALVQTLVASGYMGTEREAV
jgi:Aerotolerance regulator N-terminal/von Willebrand factor type A domain